jgi:lipopolysaccharide/colanic/teichoic acid biosynthesis glycosyltransferase
MRRFRVLHSVEVAGSPVSRDEGRLANAVKRTADIVGSGALLMLLAPTILVVALWVKLDSPGPVFYRARRVGHHGREFQMLKFRKMRGDSGGAPLTAADDERFTMIGRLLAHTKLDEVPQLWNVFVGQMSLVGPRPEDPIFVARAPEPYATILTVKPGITGLSQLAFARETTIPVQGDRVEHYMTRLFPQKTAMDTLYALSRSTLMDLRILWWTMLSVGFSVEVAVHRSTATLGRRASRAPEPGDRAATAERERPAVAIVREGTPAAGNP